MATQLQKIPPVLAIIKQRLPMMVKSLHGKESAIKRFEQAAIGVAMTPSISECSPSSVASAIYACARLGLIPDPVLKHAYIVPFRNKGTKEATLILGYQGIVELARRACPDLSLTVGTVFSNDRWVLEEGLDTVFKIIKRWWEVGDDAGEPVFHYCISRQGNAAPQLTVVSRKEAKKLGDSSKAGCRPGTPWHDWPVPMGEKTAIKRAARLWSMDPEKEETKQFREAMEADERTDEFGDDSPKAPGEDVLGTMGLEEGEHGGKAAKLQDDPAEGGIPQEQQEVFEDGDSDGQEPIGEGGDRPTATEFYGDSEVRDDGGDQSLAGASSSGSDLDPLATPEEVAMVVEAVDAKMNEAGIKATKTGRNLLLKHFSVGLDMKKVSQSGCQSMLASVKAYPADKVMDILER